MYSAVASGVSSSRQKLATELQKLKSFENFEFHYLIGEADVSDVLKVKCWNSWAT